MNCKYCGNPAKANRLHCQECLDKVKEATNRRNRERKEQGLCSDCLNPVVPGRLHCQQHLGVIAVRNKRRRAKRKEQGYCNAACGRKVDGLYYCAECHVKMCQRGYTRALAQKTQILTHYGRDSRLQCNWPGCEITDIQMLVLDHVKDDGVELGHRERGFKLYRFILREKFPEGFQTLCSNHNLKKQLMKQEAERSYQLLS